MRNRRVLLASRPGGWVSESNFRIEETALPQPAQVTSAESAAPHSPQNFTPSGFAFPQEAQFMSGAPFYSSRPACHRSAASRRFC